MTSVKNQDALICKVLEDKGYARGNADIDYAVAFEAVREEYVAGLVQGYISKGFPVDAERSRMYDFASGPLIRGVMLAIFTSGRPRRERYPHNSATKPSCVKCWSFVSTSRSRCPLIASIEMQSTKLYRLSGRRL